MNSSLEERIRRHVAQVDELAPPVEELVPRDRHRVEDGDDADTDSDTRLSIEIPIRTAGGRGYRAARRRRVITVAVAIAAAVALVVVGVAAVRPDDAPTVVDNPPTTVSTPATTVTTPPTTTPAPSPAAGAPHVVYDGSDGSLAGTGWAPNSEVTATQGDLRGDTVADAEGRFRIDDVFGHCCTFGDPLVVTDGVTTIEAVRPTIELQRVDPLTDTVVGLVNPIDSGVLTVTVAGGQRRYDTTVEFVGSEWYVDLTGEFDLLPGMTVTASVELDDITATTQSGSWIQPTLDLRPGEVTFLSGRGWLPDEVVVLTIDGEPLDGGVVTSPGGQFELVLETYGISVDAGSTITARDGSSTIEFTVPLLTYDSFDTNTLTGSGRSDLPDGTPVQVELWSNEEATDREARQDAIDTTITDGRWQVTFEPLPPGLVPVGSNITYDNDSWTYQPAAVFD